MDDQMYFSDLFNALSGEYLRKSWHKYHTKRCTLIHNRRLKPVRKPAISMTMSSTTKSLSQSDPESGLLSTPSSSAAVPVEGKNQEKKDSLSSKGSELSSLNDDSDNDEKPYNVLDSPTKIRQYEPKVGEYGYKYNTTGNNYSNSTDLFSEFSSQVDGENYIDDFNLSKDKSISAILVEALTAGGRNEGRAGSDIAGDKKKKKKKKKKANQVVGRSIGMCVCLSLSLSLSLSIYIYITRWTLI